MVWLWIVIAVTISLVLFKKNKVEYYHFIWALLPIDFYGFQLAGITIKPYMIFMFVLILFSGRLVMSSKQRNFLVFCVFVFLLSDAFNGFPFESIMQHLYFILIFVFAIQYSALACDDSESIRKAIVLSGFAFALTFVLAYSSYLYNLPMGQIKGSMVGGYYALNEGLYEAIERFRGFEKDPNALCIMFIPVVSACVYGIHVKKQRFMCLLTICLSFGCILFSKSRAGLLMFLVTVILAIVISNYLEGRLSGKLVIVFSIATIAVVLLIQLDIISISNITAYFESRSKVNDKYGRINIWRECIGYVWGESPILGIGSNQVRLYDPLGRACHNTWLEWICSLGFILGPIVDWIFVRPLFKDWKKLSTQENHGFCWVYVAYSGIFLILLSIDYIASTYLLFFFCLIDAYRNKKLLSYI